MILNFSILITNNDAFFKNHTTFLTEFEVVCVYIPTYNILEFSYYILAKSCWWKLEIGYGFNHLAIRIPNTSPVTQWAKNGIKSSIAKFFALFRNKT